MRNNFLFAAAGAAMLGLAAVPAQAVPITTVGSLSQGGTTFNAFSCNITKDGNSSPGACSSVDVSTDANGLQFQSAFSAALGGNEDVKLLYAAANPLGINAIDLTFNGQGSGVGLFSFLGFAIASVTETVYSNAARTTVVGQLTVSCGTPGSCDFSDPPLELGDMQLANALTNVWVTKDIQLNSNFAGFATISSIGQSFHTNVPEPASLALLGAGLVSLGAFKRRQKKTAA